MSDINITYDNTGTQEAKRDLAALSTGIKDLDRNMRALGTINASKAIDQTAQSLRRLDNTMVSTGRRMSRNQVIIQQLGYQVGDFFVQVQSGTNALVAFGQQGTQLAGLMPGMWGAIFGIGLSISTALILSFSKASISMDSFVESFGVLSPVMQEIADSVSMAFQYMLDGINLLINNLDRLLIYGGVVATYFATTYVAGMIAASTATGIFAASLGLLKIALITTGVGALIVILGEVIYQMIKLKEELGSWNEVFITVQTKISTAFFAIESGARSVSSYLASVAWDIAAAFIEAFSAILAKWNEIVGAIAGTFNGFMTLINSPIRMEAQEPQWVSELPDTAKQFRENASAALKDSEYWGRNVGIILGEFKDGLSGWFGGSSGEADIRDFSLGGGKKGGGGGGSVQEDKFQQEFDDLLNYLSEGATAEMQSYEDRQATLEEALNRKLLSLQEYQELERQLTQEHHDALVEIDAYRYGTALEQAGQFFGDMENALQSGGQKTLKIVKIFGAAEALINAYKAASQTLADNSLPWYAKIPAAAGVLSAGLGFMNAIKSGSTSSSSGGGGGSRGSATVPQSSAPVPQQVYVQGLDPNALFTGEMIQNIFEGLYDENDKRGKVFVVAR